MAERVVLHIGAMKSGTSYLQQRLLANPEPLAEQGVLFPGRARRDQVLGVRDILGRAAGGGRDPGDAHGAWQRLLDEMASWPGTAVISMETMASARPAAIRGLVGSLHPARVEAVITARDLARAVPAMWQEEVQNLRTWTWAEYVDALSPRHRGKHALARSFWRQQNLPAIIRRWSKVVRPENLTLVTVPPAGSDPAILWQRFCSIIEIDPDSCQPGSGSNESLGAVSAVVMRELNVRLSDRGMARDCYMPVVKHGLAKSALVARKASEQTIGFDRPWVHRRSRRMVEQLGRLPIRVLGDLDELLPRPVQGIDPSDIGVREQRDAALEALADAVMLWAAERSRRREVEAALFGTPEVAEASELLHNAAAVDQ